MATIAIPEGFPINFDLRKERGVIVAKRLEEKDTIGAPDTPPPGTKTDDSGDPVLTPEDIIAMLKPYKDLLWMGGGFFIVGGLLYAFARECKGEQTIISRVAYSPLASETADGLFDFLSAGAKAAVSSPALRVGFGILALKMFEKMGMFGQGTTNAVFAAMLGLEGAAQGASILEAIVPFGADAKTGPEQVTFSDTDNSHTTITLPPGAEAAILMKAQQAALNNGKKS